jgi:UDPglucose 6-dehydrogenase
MDSSTTSGSSRCNSPTSECGDMYKLPARVRSICCVGAGYVGESKLIPFQIPSNSCKISDGSTGGPTAAIFALQNPHIQVTVVDRDSSRIQKWKSIHLPVHEPGLARIVRITRDGTNVGSYTPKNDEGGPVNIPAREPNLSFSLDVEGELATADIVFVSVNTPTKTTGLGSGAATNLADFENVITTIAQCVRPGCIVVEKSTVPCGTAQIVRRIVCLSLILLSRSVGQPHF